MLRQAQDRSGHGGNVGGDGPDGIGQDQGRIATHDSGARVRARLRRLQRAGLDGDEGDGQEEERGQEPAAEDPAAEDEQSRHGQDQQKDDPAAGAEVREEVLEERVKFIHAAIIQEGRRVVIRNPLRLPGRSGRAGARCGGNSGR